MFDISSIGLGVLISDPGSVFFAFLVHTNDKLVFFLSSLLMLHGTHSGFVFSHEDASLAFVKSIFSELSKGGEVIILGESGTIANGSKTNSEVEEEGDEEEAEASASICSNTSIIIFTGGKLMSSLTLAQVVKLCRSESF